ncbi:MAG: HAMP domain-containing sensor histidine kinase [Gemmatimonadota bacterium]|nr:HAMP domain-containing sensor histidine kinase [Gemmatimonadota bacterium]
MRRRVTAIVVAFLLTAVLVSFIVFTRQQAQDLQSDARVFERVNALMFAVTTSPGLDFATRDSLVLQAQGQLYAELQRMRIPLVLTDTLGRPQTWAFLPDRVADGGRTASTPEGRAEIESYAEELDRQRDHLDYPDMNLQVHYGEPAILRRLRWIPWLQAGALLTIMGGGFWLLFTSFRSERERIWSAMARESAHQMGTPLSSLVGWLEVLETRQRPGTDAPGAPDIVDEMASDVDRLKKVSRRFELIGHKPDLEPVSLRDTLEHLRRYFQARLPSLSADSSIQIAVDIPADTPRVLGNETLLEWAFENLIKNSIDAMTGTSGEIAVSYLGPNGRKLGFRVRDTGPGVPIKVRDKLFDIGVSTKDSGWGVGLSLARRIVEDVHGGSIQLEETPIGASFRIEFPRAKGA